MPFFDAMPDSTIHDPMPADELRAARKGLGLTEVALAAAVDVDERTIRRWERDGAPIPLPVALLVRLALKHATVRHELGIPARKARKARQSPEPG